MKPSKLARFAPLALCLTLAACGGSDGVSAGPSRSSIDKADINGLAEMQETMIGETAGVLEGVTDEKSAKAARASLEQLADRAEALKERMQELAGGTAEDKMALAGTMMKMMGKIEGLSGELERLEDVPGVREQLEGPMERFFDSMSMR